MPLGQRRDLADDKVVVNKDRRINEPVQFFTSKGGTLLRTGHLTDYKGRYRRLPLDTQIRGCQIVPCSDVCRCSAGHPPGISLQ
jgi:hypothetical protein